MTAAIVADAIEISTGAGLVALLITAAAIAVIYVRWQATRPTTLKPGSATMDLGGERPAIVGLLTRGFDVDPDSVPATVIDLATRGHYDIEKYGGRTVLRLRQRPTDTRPLNTYEQRVLDLIRTRAIDGVTPAEVLTLGESGVSDRWLRAFGREVTSEARDLGLCERRWGLRDLAIVWGLVALAFIGPAIAGASAPRTASPLGWGSLGNILSGVAVIGAAAAAWLAYNATAGNAQVDTEAGRQAASHWLGVREHYRTLGSFREKEAAAVAIWDQHLAYATAMGLARQVERELPFSTESDTRAWSRVTGEWRRVKVAYWSPVPFWGQHPGAVAAAGLFQGVIAGVVAYFAYQVASSDTSFINDSVTINENQQTYLSLGAMIVAIVAGALLLYSVAKFVVGITDLFRRRQIQGLVVRRRDYAQGLNKYAEKVERRFRLPFRLPMNFSFGGRNRYGHNRYDSDRRYSSRNRWVAIDDGTRSRLRAYRVNQQIYGQFAQGATISVRLSPITGHLSKVTVIAPPSDLTSTDPAADPSFQQELAGRVTRAVGGRLAKSLDVLKERLPADAQVSQEDRGKLDQLRSIARRLADGEVTPDQLGDVDWTSSPSSEPPPPPAPSPSSPSPSSSVPPPPPPAGQPGVDLPPPPAADAPPPVGEVSGSGD